MKSLKVFLFSFTLFFASGALANMMCVITPAHDNPFFIGIAGVHVPVLMKDSDKKFFPCFDK